MNAQDFVYLQNFWPIVKGTDSAAINLDRLWPQDSAPTNVLNPAIDSKGFRLLPFNKQNRQEAWKDVVLFLCRFKDLTTIGLTVDSCDECLGETHPTEFIEGYGYQGTLQSQPEETSDARDRCMHLVFHRYAEHIANYMLDAL